MTLLSLAGETIGWKEHDVLVGVDLSIQEGETIAFLGRSGSGKSTLITHLYRRLIAAGRAFARFDNGRVVFKAEIGSQSPSVGQIQGVWVHPEWRGRGLGTAGTAAVAAGVLRGGRIASLYVNDYNVVARSSYARVGFRAVGTFATVLLD